MPELNWLGERKARHAARHVDHCLLEPIEQVGDAASGNLLIQGDNPRAPNTAHCKHGWPIAKLGRRKQCDTDP